MDIPFETITQSAAETQNLGEAFGHAVLTDTLQGMIRGENAVVICLWGELGSGKTTFVQGLARGLGIDSRLLSPTFVIVRHYQIPGDLSFVYHLDLYRIKGAESAHAVGFTDMIHEPRAVVIVEWPERLEEALPERRIDIHFDIQNDSLRKITGGIHG